MKKENNTAYSCGHPLAGLRVILTLHAISGMGDSVLLTLDLKKPELSSKIGTLESTQPHLISPKTHIMTSKYLIIAAWVDDDTADKWM